MATNWKRRTVCAGAMLAVGLMGSGCMEGEEDAGSSLEARREAQLKAQSFQSYGDGTLPQEIKPAPQQGTGGSGGNPTGTEAMTQQGSGDMQGPGVMQGQAAPPQSGQSGGPAWQLKPGSAAQQQQAPAAPQTNPEPVAPRPRRDSGSSEKN